MVFQINKRIIKLKIKLTKSELDYIEYRRHCAYHIFQNSYEFIQDNLRIKKERNKRDLPTLQQQIRKLILEHGSDKNTDEY